ncbi:biotin--[acetyl-CoA-carboxylase] ligase [Acinetobacter sp. WZC-1]|uniref:biotin--[acetyl-CoA-carboxylase] ligase n=1 Tax=Acinetobacter sp. WZC-1 TaxID=3459034 RepID=UPI00403D9248
MDSESRSLRQRLSEAQQLPEVLILKKSTTSTNNDVRELAQKGTRTVLVCSEMQTQGRGQHQRSWVSPAGNIYLSTLLHTRTALDGRLALEIALNILQIASFRSLPHLQIKWPNDLYSTQGKWGGILVEPLNAHQAIVGVGINLLPLSQPLPEQQTTSLTQLGLTQPDRIQIISELYLAIQQACQWFDHGSHSLAARFNHYAAFLQQHVAFEQSDQTITGKFLGVADDGSIQISTDQGISAYYQGRLRSLTQ